MDASCCRADKGEVGKEFGQSLESPMSLVLAWLWLNMVKLSGAGEKQSRLWVVAAGREQGAVFAHRRSPDHAS